MSAMTASSTNHLLHPFTRSCNRQIQFSSSILTLCGDGCTVARNHQCIVTKGRCHSLQWHMQISHIRDGACGGDARIDTTILEVTSVITGMHQSRKSKKLPR